MSDLGIYQAAAIQKLETQLPAETTRALKEKSGEFEAVFMTQMLNSMYENVDFDPMSEGSSAANDTYKGMMMEQMGKSLSSHSGIGLATPVYKALLEAQVAAQQGSPERTKL